VVEHNKGDNMAFKEEGSVNYTIINGKKVPVVKCETEVVLRNKETNYEYNSDKEAEDDIANPETPTQKEHITRSLKIKVAAMPPLGAKSSDL
jgi:ribosomal protein L13